MKGRLTLGLIAFAIWGPPSLVALPCSALLALAPDQSRRTRLLALGFATAGAALLALSSGGRLAAATQAYVLLVTVAFALDVALRSEPSNLLRHALRATAVGAVGTALLVQVVWGTTGWGTLAWESTRDAGLALRIVLAGSPDAYAIYDPVVQFASATVPGMLVLQTIAGLGLAWQWHTRLADAPLGPALAPFREFRIGDGWVWGIVAWLGTAIAPVSVALKTIGLNVGLVAGMLYLLRGIAIVVAFSQAFGISAVALVIVAGIATGLALPLLFLIPGLATLGITDTWYEYRHRLAARRPTT